MASKPLNTLTQDELREYYKISVNNAKSQWTIADTLSKVGQYGAASTITSCFSGKFNNEKIRLEFILFIK